MKKELTHKEALDYVKKNGVTLFETTEKNYTIPANTKLYLNQGGSGNLLSSYDSDTDNKNKKFNYQFDNQWYLDDHVNFILEDKYKFKVGDRVRRINKNHIESSGLKIGEISTIIELDGSIAGIKTANEKWNYNDCIELVEFKDFRETLVYINNIDESRAVQKKLFELGYEWKYSKKQIENYINQWFFIDKNKKMDCHTNKNSILDNYREISINDIIYVRNIQKVKGGIKKMTTKTLYKVVVIDKRNSEVIVDINVIAIDSKTAYVKALDGVTYDVKDLDFFHVSISSVTDFEVEKECKKTTK